MPVTYTIGQAAGLVRLECSGVFTNQEMLDSLERLHSDPARRASMPSPPASRANSAIMLGGSGFGPPMSARLAVQAQSRACSSTG